MTEAVQINIYEAYLGSQHAEHRSPRCAGSADHYYGRDRSPNFAFNGRTLREVEMTEDQRKQYNFGYDNETERKDWGGNPNTVEA
jgi:hypothetical protein